MPVRQSTQAVLLDQNRISRKSDLCRVQSNHPFKNRYGSFKMIIMSYFLEKIVIILEIIKIIVCEVEM